MTARLYETYHSEIVARLYTELSLKNVCQTPRLSKITVNMGVGEGSRDKGVIKSALSDMTLITGQKPIVTLARKSIASFNIRDGWPVGCKVTLRRTQMYEFLDRLISVAIPRIRDFRGFGLRSFDGRGNYTIGIKEQIVFPEIDYDKIDKIRGMDITITTNTNNDKYAQALLRAFNFPFRN